MSLEEIETVSTESFVLLSKENEHLSSGNDEECKLEEKVSFLPMAPDEERENESSAFLEDEATDKTSLNQSSFSWTESVEYFVEQLNDVGINYDSDNENFLGIKKVDALLSLSDAFDSDSDSQSDTESVSAVQMLKKNERFLVYLAVPVILSQLIMIIILTSNGANATPNAVVLSPITVKVHHYHYHFAEEASSKSSGFFYFFFNPFAPIYNSKYFKEALIWVKQEMNGPNGKFKYIKSYFSWITMRLEGLNEKVLGGIESEIGKAVKLRDTLNRAVYKKIYDITATPQYQQAAGKIYDWASKLKDKVFPGMK